MATQYSHDDMFKQKSECLLASNPHNVFLGGGGCTSLLLPSGAKYLIQVTPLAQVQSFLVTLSSMVISSPLSSRTRQDRVPARLRSDLLVVTVGWAVAGTPTGTSVTVIVVAGPPTSTSTERLKWADTCKHRICYVHDTYYD